MSKFVLEILPPVKNLALKSSPFYIEGFAFIEGEDGEGQKVAIRGLVRIIESHKPKLTIVN